MTPPDALVRSTSSLAPSSGPSTAVPSEADLALPPKPEPRLSFGIPVFESTKFRLSHDFARLVRSSSSVSSKSTRTGGTASTHGSRAVPSDYENEPHSGLPLHPVDLDPHDMPPLFSDSPPDSLSRRAKFYGFLSRSSSRSRSRSKSDTRPSDSGSNESPELPNATTATATSTSVTSDSHLSTVPPTLRPLSNNTTTTGETVTPKNMHTLTSRHNVQAILINDSGIGVDEPLITYDPRMPPPPMPGPAPTSQRTPTKEKRRSKPLFGLPAAPWSRPTTPKNEQVPLPSPPQNPRNRPSKVSKIENWFKHGPSFSLKIDPVADPTRFVTRSRADPPFPQIAPIRDTVRAQPHRAYTQPAWKSSDSERDGRCSPLLGLFTSTRGRGKQREHSQDRQPSRSRKPVVGAPMMRTRTASREGPSVPATKPAGGGRLPSFEFERGGGAEVRRSTSHNGHRRVVASHGHGNGNGHAHTHANHRARGHAHSNSLDMRTRGQSHNNTHHTHARSPSHTHPTRSHTHPQPSQQHRSATSPHAALNSPPPRATTDGRPGASAASQSTAGTAATNTTAGAAVTGGTGSWGRVARTIDWVRGVGVHPPFAFESAASSTASASGERRPATGGSGGAADIRERERDRDRERTRRHVVQTPQMPAAAPAPPPASPGRSVGSGMGHWEQREVELDLGLTWAPSKIRVREWTPGGTLPAQLGPADEARAARRLAEYEMGYARSRSRSRKDKEVTGRFREVLGAEGFEAFKKYVRRFDADIIPLEGASGLLGRVERLLDKAPTRHVGTREKREMLDDLVRIVRESEW
ncbi:hypothetical protein EDB87DRAFT_1709172 [Lactarius vividus]|nr:hypothetical protein EDB87DRAFT_1709172 [Lactarius vividus]